MRRLPPKMSEVCKFFEDTMHLGIVSIYKHPHLERWFVIETEERTYIICAAGSKFKIVP